MGSGGLNGELRENPNNYIDTILHYHLNSGQGTRVSSPYSFHTSRNDQPTSSSFSTSSSSSSSNPTSNPAASRDSDVDMVCYLCSVNFNILKRKKNCSSCKRDFCKECFKEGTSSLDSNVTHCLICRSLKAPHAHREYLHRIRTKDLCDFLQKKNISFQDCKEKQEIIHLVLQASVTQPEAPSLRRSPPSQPSTAWTTNRSVNTNTSSSMRNSTSYHSENTTSSNRNASNDSESIPNPSKNNGVMRTIEDIKTIDQVYSLSVKEIKRILTSNCVDFKGCFEKKELLDKVCLLWKDKNKSENKHTDDDDEEKICKVCMDNVIDCVLLECGHMITCMNCSKKVKECPICRQHVVRIVKVFKA